MSCCFVVLVIVNAVVSVLSVPLSSTPVVVDVVVPVSLVVVVVVVTVDVASVVAVVFSLDTVEFVVLLLSIFHSPFLQFFLLLLLLDP